MKPTDTVNTPGRTPILPNIKISQNEMNCLVIDAPKIFMNKLSLMI
jgi:hypothetical protein